MHLNRHPAFAGLLFTVFTLLSSCVRAEPYSLVYEVRFDPKSESADVRLILEDAGPLSSLDFNIKKGVHSDFSGDGEIEQADGRVVWTPGEGAAELRYRVKITHERESNKDEPHYDALMTDDWALFRGDDLVPPAKVKARKGAESAAELRFVLPKGWTSVETGWPRDKRSQKAGESNRPAFLIDNPARNFDRPTGWMIAGKLGTRRDWVGRGDKNLTRVSVSAPQGSSMRRMDILLFTNFVWPEFQKAFGTMPDKLLLVGGDDPMWRGGLSGPNSLFLHADRPIVSENGTSSLLHELTHMLTHISGDENDDWIAEGIAEFYSIEAMYRAGGMGEERKRKILEGLADWSKDITTLRKPRSTGATTAAATLLFFQLDDELQSKGESLDDLVKILMKDPKVSLDALREATESLLGKPSRVLQSPLLKD